MYNIVSYANKGTKEYFAQHEVRFLVALPSRNLHLLGRVCEQAKKHRLKLGRIITISNDIYANNFTANIGDSIVEIVGILESGASQVQQSILKLSGHGATVTSVSDEMAMVSYNFSAHLSCFSDWLRN